MFSKEKLLLLLLVVMCNLGSLSAVHAATDPTMTSALKPSGTLPVMYVNTQDAQPITSKETYVSATAYIDALGLEGYENMASADKPETLIIKGRGNWTWEGFDKKPYRLKFDSKVSPVGMVKSKHFLLMAGADDDLGFLRNLVGYELSRRVGLPYTTDSQPVELVLNGKYQGLYFITENIRVDKKRVNIVEQADKATDPEAITGGWLVEIDNYDTDPHINVKLGSQNMVLTYHTPEALSAEQENYLQTQWNAIAKAICSNNENDTEWEKYVDIESLAKVYIVRELLQDEEGFHGSCYLYKEQGADTKWTFGPVWDFGNAYNETNFRHFIFRGDKFEQFIIDRAWNFKHFRDKVKEVWQEFYANQYAEMNAYIDGVAAKISDAAANDYLCWKNSSNVAKNQDELAKAAVFKNYMRQKATWLVEQWGGGEAPSDKINIYVTCDEDRVPYLFAWGEANNGGWPGNQLTDTRMIGGKLFYHISLPYGTNIIFSYGDQETQTEDILNVSRDTYYRFYQAPENEHKEKKNGRFEDITQKVLTGISAVVTSKPQPAKAAIYNMNGLRVDGSYHGLVISNGRKYISK